VADFGGGLGAGEGVGVLVEAVVCSEGDGEARDGKLHGRVPMADSGSASMRLELQPPVARLCLASKGAGRRGFASKAWSAC
jgi:hypothetical protein